MSPWILIIRPNSYHSDRRLNSSFQKFSCAIWILEPCRAGNSNCKRRWRRKQPSKLVMAKFLGMQFSCHLTTSHQKGSWEVALRVLLWKVIKYWQSPHRSEVSTNCGSTIGISHNPSTSSFQWIHYYQQSFQNAGHGHEKTKRFARSHTINYHSSHPPSQCARCALPSPTTI